MRWFFFSVVLAAVPICIGWLFLPANTAFTGALQHGELAVLSAALAAAGIDVILSANFPQSSRNFLFCLNIGCLIAATAIIAAITGAAPQVTADQLTQYSVWLLSLTSLLGCIAVGLDEAGSVHD